MVMATNITTYCYFSNSQQTRGCWILFQNNAFVFNPRQYAGQNEHFSPVILLAFEMLLFTAGGYSANCHVYSSIVKIFIVRLGVL